MRAAGSRALELAAKLAILRHHIALAGLAAVRLRGVDWFAWATAGGSSTVLTTRETGVAEVLVTRDDMWILCDTIEAERLACEELPPGHQLHAHPWARPELRAAFVLERAAGGAVASDRPEPGEQPLPPALWMARRSLHPDERDRYRALGRDAAAAMSEVLRAARPTWTGLQLAGASAEALLRRAIDPALVLVGDARRLPLYRHPTASAEPLGDRVMLVYCARRHGLYANLTRFRYFRPPSAAERRTHAAVAEVEADALDVSRAGVSLEQVYAQIAAAYARVGHLGAESEHHQGGPCGYLSREAIARPGLHEPLVDGGAVAWNPSLAGAKLEDTMLIAADRLEPLTSDPSWPVTTVRGRPRPDVLAD